MSAPAAPRGPRGIDPLSRLLDDVVAARAEQEQSRRKGQQWTVELEARRETLRALEAYVAELERRAWPVPPPIRDELRLCRRLCGPGGR